METLIKQIYSEWRAANADAQRQCEQRGDFDMARKLAACRFLTGNETMPELIDKLFSPQGREFMTRFGFPKLETFRRFIPFHPEQYGVFIDAQKIARIDDSRVCLIGNTSAWLKYRETQGNTVILMHGATADIDASGFAVVKVERDAVSNVDVHIVDRAIVNL